MAQPVVKIESPNEVEANLICTTTQPSALVCGGIETAKPLPVPAQGIATAAGSKPSAYHGSSPWRYRLGYTNNRQSRAFAAPPPMMSLFPRRPLTAMATHNVNKSTASANNKTSITRAVDHDNQIYQNINLFTQQRRLKMIEYGYYEENAEGPPLPYLPQMPSIQSMINSNKTLSAVPPKEMTHDQKERLPADYAHTRTDDFGTDDFIAHNSVDNFTNQADNQFNMNGHNGGRDIDNSEVIGEVLMFNEGIQAVVQQLSKRIDAVEYENARLQSVLHSQLEQAMQSQNWRLQADRKRSRSPTLERAEMSIRNLLDSRPKRARKQLQIEIPDDAPSARAGLPTPISRASNLLSPGMLSDIPSTPVTPSRIGPGELSKKSSTSFYKRKTHSLDKMLPPAYADIPAIPLTDTEVIVYFFQSLSRPNVALRLYAREWGPRNIVGTLHEHRLIEPPYLRNTCSVKCTTAIKTGRKKYGEGWEESVRQLYKSASDDQATDLMRLDEEELGHVVNRDIRSLCNGIIKHPEEGVDGGIFTRCVKYCQDFDAPYTLQNVWQLANHLEAGRTPIHPSPTESSSLGTKNELRKKKAEDQGDGEVSDAKSDAAFKPRKTPKVKLPAARHSRAGSDSSDITSAHSPCPHLVPVNRDVTTPETS